MYKLIEVSDEVTTCECCGKRNLKRTAVLRDEDGNIVHFGSDCAAKALMGDKKHKAQIEGDMNVIAYVQKWLPVRDIQAVAAATWNKFGYSVEVRNEVLKVYFGKAQYLEFTK